jgi:nucleotide-binding universal stress UspA family protein
MKSTMRKILVAYDGSEPARRALELAGDLAQRFEAALGVVSVVPVHPGRIPVDPWDDRKVHAMELAEARELLASRGIEPQLHEPAGDTAPTIEQIADQYDYDTIVVGSRKLGVLGRVLQGSVSEHVVTHGDKTVVVAR